MNESNDSGNAWVGHEVQSGDLLALLEIQQGRVEPEEIGDFDYEKVASHVAGCILCQQELRNWAETSEFFDDLQTALLLSEEELQTVSERIEQQVNVWTASSETSGTLENQEAGRSAVVVLSLVFAFEQRRRILREVALRGAIFAAMESQQRSSDLRSSGENVGAEETQVIQFPGFQLHLHVLPMSNEFYVRMTMVSDETSNSKIENSRITWTTAGKEPVTTETDSEGTVEFFPLAPTFHEFTFESVSAPSFRLELSSENLG